MAAQTMGDRIKQVREARNISAAKFARLVGVTPTCVWNWERGATNPRPSALAAICNALEVEEPFLLVGQQKGYRHQESAPRKVDDILYEAAVRLATTLDVAQERIKLRFEVLPADSSSV